MNGGEYSVGRGPGVDWVLPDPDHTISRRHFIVAYRSGAWQISDESSNGTFINRDDLPVGKGNARNLRDNDRLRMGPYEIEVVLEDQLSPRAPAAQSYASPNADDPFAFDDPFGDPLRPVTDPPPGYGASEPPPAYRAPDIRAPDLRPPDIRPPTPHAPNLHTPNPPPVYRAPRQAPFQERTQEDHSSVMNDETPPPAQIGQMPLHAGGQLSAEGLLPDDWEKDLLEGIGDPPGGGACPHSRARPPAPDPFAPPAPPLARAPSLPSVQPQPTPYDALQPQSPQPQSLQPQSRLQPQPGPPLDPFEPVAPAATPVPLVEPMPPGAPVPPAGAHAAATSPPPAPIASPPPPAPAEPPLLDAFLAGIGLPDARPVDAAATLIAWVRHSGRWYPDCGRC